jgi:dTDP-4-dehydrorhamnose reductase
MPIKILLFGKNGQVGWELQRSLSLLGELIAVGRDDTDLCGDFTDLQGLTRTIQAVRPNIIVNAVAYTAVDKAESEPELARTINAIAPGILAQEAKTLNALLVHYSTECVFDGSGSKPWKETDATGPLSVYGKTKLEGERLIAENHSNYLIFRTAWVYAARGNNFAKIMLRLAQERERLTVVDDQTGPPTGADLLADVTAHAIRSVLMNPQLVGLYHVAASGQTSRYSYAKFVIEHALRAGVPLTATLDTITPISTEAFPTPAKRPHNSCLDTSKLESAFGLNLPHWQQGVARMLNEII